MSRYYAMQTNTSSTAAEPTKTITERKRTHLSAIVRQLRAERFQFHSDCPRCREVDKAAATAFEALTWIEGALVNNGDEHLLRKAYAALGGLIQEEYNLLTKPNDDNPDF